VPLLSYTTPKTNFTMTHRQHLEQLEEPYRTEAIGNATEDLDFNSYGLSSTLSGVFLWCESPQGHKYWSDLFNSL